MFWDRYDNTYDPLFSMRAPQRQRRPVRRVVRPSPHYYEDDMLDMSAWPFGMPARKSRPTRPSVSARAQQKKREITLEEAEDAARVLQAAYRTHVVRKHKVLPNLRALAESQKRVQDFVRRFTAKLSNRSRSAEQTRLCYAAFGEELTREMLSLDQITTHNETVVREKRKALVKRIQELLGEVDRELPKWEKRAEEELTERRRLKEAQRRAEEEAAERASEEARMRHIQVQTSDDEDFCADYSEEDVEMTETDNEDRSDKQDSDAEYYSDSDEDLDEAMQVEGATPMPQRARMIMEELHSLQEKAAALERERQQLAEALSQCERKANANQERRSQLKNELETYGWMDGHLH